jgi:hypothetical protein
VGSTVGSGPETDRARFPSEQIATSVANLFARNSVFVGTISRVSSQASLALRDEDQTTASERTDEGDERANQRASSKSRISSLEKSRSKSKAIRACS